MQVIFCSAEVAPFAKVGGLADVAGSLPKALKGKDVEPIVVMPRYGCVDIEKFNLTLTETQFNVDFKNGLYAFSVFQGTLPGSDVPVYFLDNRDLISNFDDVYPYGNAELEVNRFLLFGQGVFEFIRQMNWTPDVLHCHDWHTANIITQLNQQKQTEERFKNTRSIITIHNLAYQGNFDGINWLEAGLKGADKLTTVSPTYAKEIQTAEFGEGLDWLLRERSNDLVGIVNGIDTDLFNPETDHFIAQQYSSADFSAGKAKCKEAIQTEIGLPKCVETPVIGFVSRLVDQKGLDIMMPALEKLNGADVHVAILGSGNPEYEEKLKWFNANTRNIRTYIGFNLALAQKIYAGSDFFLMPSRFEPCGLGQLIAFRYGSIPIAREVGGLADTVIDASADQAKGNGFTFHDYQSDVLNDTINRGLAAYANKDRWNDLTRRAMSQELGWEESAKHYITLYQSVSQPALT